jgi:hypothetical protein
MVHWDIEDMTEDMFYQFSIGTFEMIFEKEVGKEMLKRSPD